MSKRTVDVKSFQFSRTWLRDSDKSIILGGAVGGTVGNCDGEETADNGDDEVPTYIFCGQCLAIGIQRDTQWASCEVPVGPII
jgi:hypothetical protein